MTFFSTKYNTVKNKYYSFLCDRKDFRTNRHIVVFESDDWGSIRMSNKKDWEELLKRGYAVDKRPYERFDTLESTEDLEALFEVLCKYKDCNGNHPVITANMLMANPDFERIKKSGGQMYFFEPIAKTYERYFGDTKVLELMRQGMEAGVFMPQSHGREHFNVEQWMKGLQTGDEDLLTAFQFGMCGIAPKAHPEKGNQLMNALRAYNSEEQEQIDAIVAEGLQLFERLWGFHSHTFVAPCYCWNNITEQTLVKNGVKLIQTSRSNKPAFNDTKHFYYSGQQSSDGLKYSIRNCSFEPSTNAAGANLSILMKQVDDTFSQHKLAVFSTHRINYVSGISEQNRTCTLNNIDLFLTTLLNKYPDVEFLSSDKLISLL